MRFLFKFQILDKRASEIIGSVLFLANGKKELHDKSLEKLEQLLSHTFERIHESYLVRLSEVKGIIVKPGSKHMAELKNGAIIPIGRTKYKDIKAKWL